MACGLGSNGLELDAIDHHPKPNTRPSAATDKEPYVVIGEHARLGRDYAVGELES